MKKIFILSLFFLIIGFTTQETPISSNINKNGDLIINYSTSKKTINFKKLGYEGIKCSRYSIFSMDRKYISFIFDGENEKNCSEEDKKSSVLIYDIINNKLIFSINVNYLDSPKIDYINSSKYPFRKLNKIEKAYFNSKSNIVVFETLAWAVCNSIHSYDHNTNTVKFITAGNLISFYKNGNFKVELTGINENKGRWTMQVL